MFIPSLLLLKKDNSKKPALPGNKIHSRYCYQIKNANKFSSEMEFSLA